MTSMTLITGIINIISENIMSYFSNEMLCGNPQKSANIQICFIKLEAILFKLKKKSICIYGKNVKGNVIFWGSQWRYLQLIYLTVALWIQQGGQNKLIGVFIKKLLYVTLACEIDHPIPHLC